MARGTAKDMTKDMTQGSPMKLIWGFAVPILFGSLFQQLYNLVDTMIVGRFLGVDSLAAVGATGSVWFLTIGFALVYAVALQFRLHINLAREIMSVCENMSQTFSGCPLHFLRS